ncbi:MAG: hypothetical protein H7145_17120 [Akkermansiaceae bacterium]|nr:hypothetical protein [Armatimonadota bacterium]
MPITLELSPDLENDLRIEATRRNVGVEKLASDYFSRSWRSRHRKRSPLDILTPGEQEVIEKLNAELTREFWHRYKELERKISDADFSEAEREEALEMSRRSEAWNVRRITAIDEMARRRGMKWDELMRQLKISHHPGAKA